MRLSWNEIHSRAAAFARKREGAGMTRWKHPQVIALIVLLTAAGCSGNKNITDIGPDPCNDGFQRKAFDHHVIGFYPGWKHDVLPVSRIQWDKLTRVIYAFAIPNTDGSLNVSRLAQVEALAETARAQGPFDRWRRQHAGRTRRTFRGAPEPDTIVEETAHRERRGGVRPKPQRSGRTRQEDRGASREDRRVVDGEGFFIEGARSRPIAERRAMIARTHRLPVVRQCKLLELSRSTAYYRPREESKENLAVMKEIDRLYMERPTSGSRTIKSKLHAKGVCIARKGPLAGQRVRGAPLAQPQTGRSLPARLRHGGRGQEGNRRLPALLQRRAPPPRA